MVRRAETDFDQALTERLGAAVQELNLPATVVLMRDPPRGWVERSKLGFFLVDRGVAEGTKHHIEVFVYPDRS